MQGVEKGRGKGVPMGREAVSPWETSNALQPCDQPAPWLSADSSLTAPLRLLHTHIHTHTHIHLLATTRALTLSDLSTHNTTHSNSIDIRTLMLILTHRMHVFDTFAPTSILIITLNNTKVPLLQLKCQGQHTIPNCCS